MHTVPVRTWGKNEPQGGGNDPTTSIRLASRLVLVCTWMMTTSSTVVGSGSTPGFKVLVLSELEALNIATIGWNHYIAGPNTKLSVDWNWCFSAIHLM